MASAGVASCRRLLKTGNKRRQFPTMLTQGARERAGLGALAAFIGVSRHAAFALGGFRSG